MPSDFSNYISQKIKNAPDKKSLYYHALTLLLRRKLCAKEFLEVLLQAQTTQARALNVVNTLEEMRALLYNDINYNENMNFGNGINLSGFVNNALDDLEDFFGIYVELTKPIRDVLDKRDNEIQLLWPTSKLNSVIKNSSDLLKEQKSIVYHELENTIRLYRYFISLFSAKASHAIAQYAVQHVDIICPANIASSVFSLACAVDELRTRVDPQVVQQEQHKISNPETEAMFKYVFGVTNHATGCYQELVDIVGSPIATQYVHTDEIAQRAIPVAPASPSTASSDSGIVVQPCANTSDNESIDEVVQSAIPAAPASPRTASSDSDIVVQPCAHTNDKKSYASAVRTPLSVASVQSHGSGYNRNSVAPNTHAKLRRKTTGKAHARRTNVSSTKTQPINSVTERSVKHTAEKSHEAERKYSFAEFIPYLSDDGAEEAAEESIAQPDESSTKESKKSGQKKKRKKKKKSSNPQPAQKEDVASSIESLVNENNSITENALSLDQLLQAADIFEKKHVYEKSGKNYIGIKIKNIKACLEGGLELCSALSAALKEKPDKSKRRIICEKKRKTNEICAYVQEELIPGVIKKTGLEITKYGLDTPIETFYNLGNLIVELSELGSLERYAKHYESSQMKKFLNTLTELSKAHFFASADLASMPLNTDLMMGISNQLSHLTKVLTLKKALHGDVLFSKKEQGLQETIDYIDNALKKIQISQKDKPLLLRKLINPLYSKKIFHIMLQDERFELSKLLVLANVFKSNAEDLNSAHNKQAWDIVFVLLHKGADPFSVCEHGRMAFENIVESNIEKNIVFCIKQIEKDYDQLKASQLPILIDLLFHLPITQGQDVNFAIRNAVICLLRKKPELTEIPSQTGVKMREHSVFKKFLDEIAEIKAKVDAARVSFWQRRNRHTYLADEQHVTAAPSPRLETSL